jgi:hypothetical protein
VFENDANRTPKAKAEPAIRELGGTMDPPGPASPIDPDLFFKRPSYSGIWLDEPQRPPRCEADRSRGPSPHTWIAEALENETFAGNAVFTQGYRRVAAKSKGRPLASNGNIIRAQKSEEFAGLIQDHLILPGSVLRFAPTSVRARSISRAVIYQAHHFPSETLAAEIARVCAPGAKISLYGIEPCFTDRPFGGLIWKLLESLAPLRSPGERLLRNEFRGFPLKFNDSTCLLTDKVIKPQFATAQWTFYELLAYLRTYPWVQRIEWQPTLVHRKFSSAVHDLLWGVFWPGLDELKSAWGSPKKTRLVRWSVWVRTGFLPSHQQPGCAVAPPSEDIGGLVHVQK